MGVITLAGSGLSVLCILVDHPHAAVLTGATPAPTQNHRIV